MILLPLFFAISALGAEAHVHGAATLSVAFDGAVGKIEFRTPSDGVIGFEHEAKTPTDKKKRKAGLEKFNAHIGEMIQFDKSLGCAFSKEKLDTVKEAETHSDVVAEYNVGCKKSPLGTVLTLSFKKYFPALTDVDTQILIDNLQKSAEVRGDGTRVELK